VVIILVLVRLYVESSSYGTVFMPTCMMIGGYNNNNLRDCSVGITGRRDL
jgi:hypothetical protein